MGEFLIRPSRPDDIGRMLEIYEHARSFMAETGNPTQWAGGYPSRELLLSDMEQGAGRVMEKDGRVCAAFALFTGVDPTYREIENGAWLNDGPYAAIHRIAGDGTCRGVVRAAVGYALTVRPNVRIDTHRDNRVMRHTLEKIGFAECGVIHTFDGTPRIAFQICAPAGPGALTPYEEIPISQVGGVAIGQAEDEKGGTGCTVFACPQGMRAGIDIRGGGPASRETPLLDPCAAAKVIHAVVLAGGSAYGLAAADGVMRCLEERGIGYDTGHALVPLVVQSDVYDLSVGDSAARPDAGMGYEAARLALDGPNYKDGCFGAGCGASVGKIAGMARAMKSGIGSFAAKAGELRLGAVAVVNALGDVYELATGRQIAGLLSEDGKSLSGTVEHMLLHPPASENRFTGNTTLAVVITNAAFDKPLLCRVARMAQDGISRSIRPVHTSADGDSVYALSAGDVKADPDLVGILAADAVSEAIERAVRAARGSFGLPAARDLE